MKPELIKKAVTQAYISRRIVGATPKEMAITAGLPIIHLLEKVFNSGKLGSLSKYNNKFDRVYQAMAHRVPPSNDRSVLESVLDSEGLKKHLAEIKKRK